MPNLIASFDGGARPGPPSGAERPSRCRSRSATAPRWKRDPWSGDIVDGRVHGRGTVDMKCGTTALLFVFAYLHRLRAELPGRVTLTVVSDEETGGKWGAAWLVEQLRRRRCWATAC